MKKWIFGMAALAAAMCFGATTEDGVTKERRGALGPNDMVVTDVDATGIVAARTYTKAEVDRRIATNAPVRSVNGKTGRVVLSANDVGALPNNRDGLKANANFRNAVWDVQIKSGGCDTNTVDALANSAVVTNALTVATTNRVAALETATNNLSSSVSGLESTKADKAAPSYAGNLAALTADGNLSDSGKKASDFAPAVDGGYLSQNGGLVSGAVTILGDFYVGPSGNILGVTYDAGYLFKDGSVKWYYGEWGGEWGKEDANEIAVKGDISATNPTFSNAVLAVNVDFATNTTGAAYVAVTNALAGFGFDAEALAELPGGKVYGSIGALLAALAAAVAWLKKKALIGGLTGGVPDDPKVHDFFTESNSLLTGTIDDRLPIPISAKSAGFTTESYKRFIVTVSGDMTVTLHTPTSGDAEIFECRFNGTSLAADASITFAGATATTMDANCGTVTAGKVALMSAFWNGATWDVNWKVEG